MLTIKNLITGYGQSNVLHKINLTVQSGEHVALLGANGSGKTTLLRAICGLLPIKSGTILLNGSELSALSEKERAKKVAVLPQKISAPEGLTVKEMVLAGRYAHLPWWGLYSSKDYAVVEQILELTGTKCFANNPATQLSGGELQRVMLARTLAQESKLILLDELSSGLDLAALIELFDLLENLRRSGYAFLSVLHDCNLAVYYATRLIGLKKGQILFDGTLDEVCTEKLLSELYEFPIRILHCSDWQFPQIVPAETHGYADICSDLSNVSIFA